MQRDENLLHINSEQKTDAIQTSYHKTGGVYTRQSGLVQIHPYRPLIRFRASIGSNSTLELNTTHQFPIAFIKKSFNKA